MTLGPLMVDVAGLGLTPEDRDILRHPLVGSVILFTRNYESPQQLSALTADIRSLRTPPLLIAVDHEGGRVQRFRQGFTALPALRTFGRQYDSDPQAAHDAARSTAWIMAIELRAVGVDFSFAPCVDIDYGLSTVVGDRALHSDAEVIGTLAVAYLAGMRDAGMAGTAKHFPGHGHVVADSHVALPVDRRDFAQIEADMQPYRRLIDNRIAGVLAAHVVFPAVDDRPASLSRKWLKDVLRRQLGFHGCVFADDLSMAGAAAFGGVAERCRLALDAGCDVLPICNDRNAVVAVLAALSRLDIDGASMARLVRMRGRGSPAFSNLVDNAEWRSARQRIAALNQAPTLTLTEGRE
jgi:beta-N-acetylhexosaminidase